MREPGEGVARRLGCRLVVGRPVGEQLVPEIGLFLEIDGAGLAGVEIGPPRRLGDGVVERAEAVDQAELAGGAAVPDPALADLVDPRRRQPPGPRDQGDEAAIGRLDAHLQQPVGLGRRARAADRARPDSGVVRTPSAPTPSRCSVPSKLGKMPNTPIEPVIVEGSAKMTSPAVAIQ